MRLGPCSGCDKLTMVNIADGEFCGEFCADCFDMLDLAEPSQADFSDRAYDHPAPTGIRWNDPSFENAIRAIEDR